MYYLFWLYALSTSLESSDARASEPAAAQLKDEIKQSREKFESPTISIEDAIKIQLIALMNASRLDEPQRRLAARDLARSFYHEVLGLPQQRQDVMRIADMMVRTLRDFVGNPPDSRRVNVLISFHKALDEKAKEVRASSLYESSVQTERIRAVRVGIASTLVLVHGLVMPSIWGIKNVRNGALGFRKLGRSWSNKSREAVRVVRELNRARRFSRVQSKLRSSPTNKHLRKQLRACVEDLRAVREERPARIERTYNWKKNILAWAKLFGIDLATASVFSFLYYNFYFQDRELWDAQEDSRKRSLDPYFESVPNP